MVLFVGLPNEVYKLAKKTEGCEDLKLSQELGKKEALLELGKYCK